MSPPNRTLGSVHYLFFTIQNNVSVAPKTDPPMTPHDVIGAQSQKGTLASLRQG